MINVYLNYNDISFDSGESYAKIKAKVKLEENFTLHGEMVEIGHSIKTQLPENNIACILKFIEYVERVRKKEECQKIPVFSKIKDEDTIHELDERLLEKIEENIECINISELDIIGATEIFNNKHQSLPDMPRVEKVAVWIVLKRCTHLPEIDGKPDLSSLKMIMLKNRLDAWKKEVRILGYIPVVYLNYWED